MRIATIAALAALFAAPAIAQVFPAQLGQAERDRDAIMSAVDAAIQANDWATACTRAKEATDSQRAIATTASEWLDKQDADLSVSDEDFETLSLRVDAMWEAHASLSEASTGICKRAAE